MTETKRITNKEFAATSESFQNACTNSGLLTIIAKNKQPNNLIRQASKWRRSTRITFTKGR